MTKRHTKAYLIAENRRKTIQLRTDGMPSTKAAVSAIWGPKALEHLVELDLKFDVKIDKAVRRMSSAHVILFPLSVIAY